MLTKEYLYEEYVVKEKSLGDIAIGSSCSRQYVSKRMANFGITLRSKVDARENALDDGKIVFKREDKSIVLQKNTVNEAFFESFSPAMAYVLGVIYTDGWIDPGSKLDRTKKTTVKVGRLSLGQKDPELLQKVLNLMASNAKLYFRKKGIFENTIAGELYFFHINSDKIYHDLTKLGLTPAKSLIMKFPNIPTNVMRHFLRGCWDGDGSIFIDKTTNNFVADYVCGSLSFITDMERTLNSAGMPARRVAASNGVHISYNIKYSGTQCERLFHYFYDGVDASEYLTRKCEVFKQAHLKYHKYELDL